MGRDTVSAERPTLGPITRRRGIAGQFSLSVAVTYPGEAPSTAVFVGHVDGGPIVLVMPSGVQTFVHSSVLDRIGHTLTPEWVARFYGVELTP
jgi:hypothetical protein